MGGGFGRGGVVDGGIGFGNVVHMNEGNEMNRNEYANSRPSSECEVYVS